MILICNIAASKHGNIYSESQIIHKAGAFPHSKVKLLRLPAAAPFKEPTKELISLFSHLTESI